MSKQFKADTALLLVTVGWGTSFILTKNSLSEIPTFNFLAIRFILAFIISSIVFFRRMVKVGKNEIKYGVLLGVFLFGTYAFQTAGLNYTTASKSAFITGFSVVLVPVFSSFILKDSFDRKSYISVAMAFSGLAMLTLNQNISGVNIGDMLTFFCAVTCATHIVLIGKYTSKVESISCAVIQIGVVGLLSLLASLIFEYPAVPPVSGVWFNIIILSVVCTSGAYIIQNVAQKFTSPTHTALIYTAEPVFAGIFAYVILDEVLSLKGIIGAALILSSMIISEVDFKALLCQKAVKDIVS